MHLPQQHYLQQQVRKGHEVRVHAVVGWKVLDANYEVAEMGSQKLRVIEVQTLRYDDPWRFCEALPHETEMEVKAEARISICLLNEHCDWHWVGVMLLIWVFVLSRVALAAGQNRTVD